MHSASKLIILAVGAMGLLCSSVARAGDVLTFTITDPSQAADLGQTVPFTATVSAPITNADTIFLLGDSFNVGSPLTLDDSPYFSTFPLSLNPGDSFTGVLFNVFVPETTPLGDYLGSFTVGGSTDGSTENLDVTDGFDVTAIPEPSTVLLFGTGFAGIVMAVRRKRLA